MSHLALKTELSPKQHDHISKIHNSASLWLSIINEILHFSKVEAGKISIETIEFLDEYYLRFNTLLNSEAFEVCCRHINDYDFLSASIALSKAASIFPIELEKMLGEQMDKLVTGVLVADDSAENRVLLSGLLKPYYKVKVDKNGKQTCFWSSLNFRLSS